MVLPNTLYFSKNPKKNFAESIEGQFRPPNTPLYKARYEGFEGLRTPLREDIEEGFRGCHWANHHIISNLIALNCSYLYHNINLYF